MKEFLLITAPNDPNRQSLNNILVDAREQYQANGGDASVRFLEISINPINGKVNGYPVTTLPVLIISENNTVLANWLRGQITVNNILNYLNPTSTTTTTNNTGRWIAIASGVALAAIGFRYFSNQVA